MQRADSKNNIKLLNHNKKTVCQKEDCHACSRFKMSKLDQSIFLLISMTQMKILYNSVSQIFLRLKHKKIDLICHWTNSLWVKNLFNFVHSDCKLQNQYILCSGIFWRGGFRLQMSRHSFVITFVRLKPLGLRIYHGVCNSIQHLLTATSSYDCF